MPPGSPVGEVDSRASASSARPDALSLRPAAATTSASDLITADLSSPRSSSSRTSARSIRGVDMAVTSVLSVQRWLLVLRGLRAT